MPPITTSTEVDRSAEVMNNPVVQSRESWLTRAG